MIAKAQGFFLQNFLVIVGVKHGVERLPMSTKKRGGAIPRLIPILFLCLGLRVPAKH
jgi:hypothetical protein